MQQRAIQNIGELNAALEMSDGGIECAILLGCIRSSKHISRDARGRYIVDNYIDGSRQRLTERQLMSDAHTNVGRAMREGAFVIFEETMLDAVQSGDKAAMDRLETKATSGAPVRIW